MKQNTITKYKYQSFYDGMAIRKTFYFFWQVKAGKNCCVWPFHPVRRLSSYKVHGVVAANERWTRCKTTYIVGHLEKLEVGTEGSWQHRLAHGGCALRPSATPSLCKS